MKKLVYGPDRFNRREAVLKYPNGPCSAPADLEKMKYFTYDLLEAANDWIEQTEEERRRAEARWPAEWERYYRDLDALKTRISGPAWNFFRYGGNETGLHDGRLISASVGDGLDYPADGISPFYLDRQRMTARLEFLNYEQDRFYTFDLRGVGSYRGDLFIEEDRPAKSIGDLYLCELSSVDKDVLQLGFLFASGSSIVVEFRRLIFRRRRIARKYEIGEMYKP